jgi:hypothetical protein
MEAILSFFSNLILFTAGLVVIALWLVVIAVVAIELWDLITGNDGTKEEDQ